MNNKNSFNNIDPKYQYLILLVDIPDINEKTRHYITYTCTYDEIKQNNFVSRDYTSGECYSSKYNNNSEWLSDKCIIDNHYIFTDETPIVHCDEIYTSGRHFTCRMFFYDLFKRGFYSMQIQEPFDSEGTGYATFYAFAFWSTIASG
ncbi:hypothetical protein H8356DRAFT_1327488 [Neocallimastix lanati (nom. inval.)]|nr:hypothetical protein H8356DRAFT_1327488 [Neocallimastix sp. JGI-2020a]